MNNWYVYEGEDATNDPLWLCDVPPLSAYFEINRGWCWSWWDEEHENEAIDGAEGFDTAEQAMADADRAVREATQ